MTVREFEDNYYLHDSNIEKIFFDADKKILTLEIFFCFWMQEWYDKNEPSNGLIRVTFKNVSHVEFDEHSIENNLADLEVEILDIDVDEDNTLILGTVDYGMNRGLCDGYYQLKISAANVEVEELARYNL